MSELLELLEERKDLSKQEDERRKEAEELIESALKDEDYLVNEVNVVSSYYEFDVVMDSRIGILALRDLDDVFPEFRVESVHVTDYDGCSLLKIFFKHNDRFDEDGDTGG